jgi:four helix bundle protein
MLKLNHKKLKVWKSSLLLVKEVYHITSHFPAAEKFGLISQMRRAAISISSNISEGASRNSQKERSRFYEIARSSLVELDTQIELSNELSFLDNLDTSALRELMNATFAMLSKMISNTY